MSIDKLFFAGFKDEEVSKGIAELVDITRERTYEEDRLRIMKILSMFHPHDPGLCGDIDPQQPECVVFDTIRELVWNGREADAWHEEHFKKDYEAWTQWRKFHGIIND